MKHYFFFNKRENAHDFYLKAISNGIYASYSYDSNIKMHRVEIDIDKTMEAKNAKTKE
jgi:hypothetical protein